MTSLNRSLPFQDGGEDPTWFAMSVNSCTPYNDYIGKTSLYLPKLLVFSGQNHRKGVRVGDEYFCNNSRVLYFVFMLFFPLLLKFTCSLYRVKTTWHPILAFVVRSCSWQWNNSDQCHTEARATPARGNSCCLQAGCYGWSGIAWVSYQIRKIAGCVCAGNTGNVYPAIDFKGNR